MMRSDDRASRSSLRDPLLDPIPEIFFSIC
jgi:hypothetical protein